MISRTEYHEMMGAYQYALEKVVHATEAAEEDFGVMSSAGGGCRQGHCRIIGQMNDLCRDLRIWIQYYEGNAEVG